MKVVNCVHCGTPNIVQEGAIKPTKCTNCGNDVELTSTLLNALPTWLIFVLDILGVLLLIGLIPLMYYI